MSLLANIDHLAIASGIEAVVVEAKTDSPRSYRGDQTWHPVLDGALDLFGRTEEKSIRLVVGKHTIVVQKENEEVVSVVLPTGHAIAKSLRRMIRRMARKDRGPLPKARELTPPAAATTPPSEGQPTVAPKPEEATAATPASAAPPSPGTERGNFPSF